MQRKTSGFWMINGNPVCIFDNMVCDYPDNATIVEYSSEEELFAAHKQDNPDLYPSDEEE